MSTFQGSRPAGGARWCDTVAQAKPGCSKARLPASQTSATYWGIQRLVVVWLWKQCEVSMLTNRRTREAQRGHHRIDRVDNRPGKHWRKRDAIGIRSASSGTSIQYTSSMKRGILGVIHSRFNLAKSSSKSDNNAPGAADSLSQPTAKQQRMLKKVHGHGAPQNSRWARRSSLEFFHYWPSRWAEGQPLLISDADEHSWSGSRKGASCHHATRQHKC